MKIVNVNFAPTGADSDSHVIGTVSVHFSDGSGAEFANARQEELDRWSATNFASESTPRSMLAAWRPWALLIGDPLSDRTIRAEQRHPRPVVNPQRDDEQGAEAPRKEGSEQSKRPTEARLPLRKPRKTRGEMQPKQGDELEKQWARKQVELIGRQEPPNIEALREYDLLLREKSVGYPEITDQMNSADLDLYEQKVSMWHIANRK